MDTNDVSGDLGSTGFQLMAGKSRLSLAEHESTESGAGSHTDRGRGLCRQRVPYRSSTPLIPPGVPCISSAVKALISPWQISKGCPLQWDTELTCWLGVAALAVPSVVCVCAAACM